jgi:hypothetical protein
MFGKAQFGVGMNIMAQRHQWRHQRSNLGHGSGLKRVAPNRFWIGK